jgi:PIN domain nuclease of toxin-antitoxin system
VSRFLVDTQLLVWNVLGSRKLPARVARLFRDGRHDFYASAASLWEFAIKASAKPGEFGIDAIQLRETLLENGFRELPVTGSHAIAVSRLPAIHHDPFDRLLVAQALVEPMVLVTADEKLAAYPGNIEVIA